MAGFYSNVQQLRDLKLYAAVTANDNMTNEIEECFFNETAVTVRRVRFIRPQMKKQML
jgi:hypothetical protein